jgi:hypothetical protein
LEGEEIKRKEENYFQVATARWLHKKLAILSL